MKKNKSEPVKGFRWAKQGDPVCYSDPYQKNGKIRGTVATEAIAWIEGNPYGNTCGFGGIGYLKALMKEELGK